MNKHKSSAQLKALAKEQLLGKYSPAIGAVALMLLINYALTYFGMIFNLLPGVFGAIVYYTISFVIGVFSGIFTYGLQCIFLKVACNAPFKVSDLFIGFKSGIGKILLAQLIISSITTAASIPFYILSDVFMNTQNIMLMGPYYLSMLLLYVVMIFAELIFGQVYYIMLDFPQYTATKALGFSAKLMKGNKGRLFYLQMSFIPLYLLGICTFCIGFLWIMPYIRTTMANFYIDLVQNKDF